MSLSTFVKSKFLILGSLGFLYGGCAFSADLPIYVYDSFMAKGGLGQKTFPLFEARTGCKVKALVSGDAGAMVARAKVESERARPKGAILLGFDHTQWAQIKKWIPQREPPAAGDPPALNLKEVAPAIGEKLKHLGPQFFPFDFGVVSLIVDTEKVSPEKIRELHLGKIPAGFSVLAQDPRASSTGLTWVMYLDTLPNGLRDFKKAVLAWAPGWDASYGMFLKGKSDAVVSYTTSQAYHDLNDAPSGRYKAVLFGNRGAIQIEGAAILSNFVGTPEVLECRRKFMAFLHSLEFQKEIPLHQWMFPILKEAPLPKAFQDLPVPKEISLGSTDADHIKGVIKKWGKRE